MIRITFLLGAGAMIEATNIGTGTITEKVIDACKGLKLKDDVSILDHFANDFNEKHKGDQHERTANFEDLYDILEGLADYRYPKFNDSSNVILSELKEKYKDIDFSTIYDLRRKILGTINNTVAEYDKKFSSNGMWMRDFFLEYINRENVCIDVFNLNYDTWIEQILETVGYNDGFENIEGYEDFQRFSVSKYLTDRDKHTVSHLHGQICFEESEFQKEDINRYAFEEQEYTLYKYKDFEKAEDYRQRHTRSDIRTQSGHNVIPANIITGRMKTDKLLWAPLQMYMYGLIKALMENDELFIIGYGFGDQYINHLLFQYLQKHRDNRKIHMITKIKKKKYEEMVTIYGTPFQDRQSVFAQCIMNGMRWCSPFKWKDSHMSKDLSAEIYMSGFEKYCRDYVGK